jgi:N utilization substance protein B
LTGECSADIEQHLLSRHDRRRIDRAYFRALVTGVMAHVSSLDQLLAPWLDRPVEQLDPVERAIVRIGAFELAHRPDVPWRVVLDEAVELAKIFGAAESYRYVNGVLDHLARANRSQPPSRQSAPTGASH